MEDETLMEETLMDETPVYHEDPIKNDTYGYIDKITNGEAKLGLPKAAKAKLGDYLVSLKAKYSDAASLVNKYDASHPVYKENIAVMNDIQESITNLAGQVKAYEKNQSEFIQDFDGDALSNGIYVEGKGEKINKLYTGKLDMEIDNSGNILFGEDGNYSNLSTLSQYYLKDFGSADKILKLTNQIYNQAQPLSAMRKSMAVDQIKSIVKQGGRDSVISLINDDLIPGLDGSQIPKEYYKRENFDKLSEWFYGKLGAGIEAAAKAGYEDKLNKMEAQGDLKFQQHQRSKLFDKDISIQTAEEKAKIKQQYGGGTATTTKGGKGGKTTTNLSVAELHRQNLAKEKAKLDAMKNNGNAVSAKTK